MYVHFGFLYLNTDQAQINSEHILSLLTAIVCLLKPIYKQGKLGLKSWIKWIGYKGRG